jgi:chromosome segregation ATPase
MRLPTLLRLISLTTLFGLTAFSLPAQDQSSGDVAAAARKAREQQKNAPKPTKVVTNDDFPSANNNAPVADATADKSGGQQEAVQTSDEAKEENAENDPKSEVYWRKRFQKAHDKLAQSEKELDILQRELDKNQVQYYTDPQQALMQQHDRSDINQNTAKIDAKKKEIEALKQQLSDMEDDLRKAGGDPGWAR